MDSSLQFSLSLLRDAFAKLLATFELSGITVQSLVRTAGINRSTFYRHFNNINDFTEWLSDQMLEEISSQVILTPEDELDFTEFYQYATKNRLLLSSILTTKGWKEFIIRLHSLVLRRYTLLLKKKHFRHTP
ncbi:hypothetical protein AYR63_04795 [Secundilactobacillus paracollinoides]|uniref:HTH tetR-type domain-containing protein n=1 Tax=Secundilactobacillus paracollinoides TaxID=240427 RepID=A0A1B2IWV0_9LACO|nr:hypothetical protein AYR63_04795 [Secundilactobacillus paracollinoides]